MTSKPPKTRGETWNIFSQPSEETNPANTMILNFLLPKLGDSKFLLFMSPQFVVPCYGSPAN